MDPLPYANDQLVDAAMARALHADALGSMDRVSLPWPGSCRVGY